MYSTNSKFVNSMLCKLCRQVFIEVLSYSSRRRTAVNNPKSTVEVQWTCYHQRRRSRRSRRGWSKASFGLNPVWELRHRHVWFRVLIYLGTLGAITANLVLSRPHWSTRRCIFENRASGFLRWWRPESPKWTITSPNRPRRMKNI